MSNEIANINKISAYELALVQNDLSKLNQQERLSLYNKTCESLGLNPLTQPFGYIEFRGGKLSLYAKKDCTDQLRKLHGVSVIISSKETIGDNFVVMAKAKDKDGREDEDMGSVSIKGLYGDLLGNAMMKAITKAKRRVTLSICGLGMLDETETETIKDAEVKNMEKEPLETKTITKSVLNKSDTTLIKTEAPSPNPIINHAPTNNTDLDNYKLRFSWGSFKAGLTFEQLGKKDTEGLLKGIQSWKLSKESKGETIPTLCEEFIDLAKQYLKRFE